MAEALDRRNRAADVVQGARCEVDIWLAEMTRPTVTIQGPAGTVRGMVACGGGVRTGEGVVSLGSTNACSHGV